MLESAEAGGDDGNVVASWTEESEGECALAVRIGFSGFIGFGTNDTHFGGRNSGVRRVGNTAKDASAERLGVQSASGAE